MSEMCSTNCKNIQVKVENGCVITYCATCGKIIDVKPAPAQWNENPAITCNNGMQILHD